MLENAHPLNNYDINYISGTPVEVFTITYYANGGAGGPHSISVISGKSHMILTVADTGISRTGYTFTGWNTEEDGRGMDYKPGDEESIRLLYFMLLLSISLTGLLIVFRMKKV